MLENEEKRKIEERLKILNQRIENACKRASKRKPSIVFATKYANSLQIKILYDLVPDLKIGENRVQEALIKFEELKRFGIKNIEKHFIGNIQSNKIKKIILNFDVVESVSSIKTASLLEKYASYYKKQIPIFIEVNNGQQTKSGFKIELLEDALSKIQSFKNLRILGLMGMGIENDSEKTRKFFRFLRTVADNHGFQVSMGMSGDFEIAIEEGTDIIRIGRFIFEK
jgi:hypothetical protein